MWDVSRCSINALIFKITPREKSSFSFHGRGNCGSKSLCNHAITNYYSIGPESKCQSPSRASLSGWCKHLGKCCINFFFSFSANGLFTALVTGVYCPVGLFFTNLRRFYMLRMSAANCQMCCKLFFPIDVLFFNFI